MSPEQVFHEWKGQIAHALNDQAGEVEAMACDWTRDTIGRSYAAGAASALRSAASAISGARVPGLATEHDWWDFSVEDLRETEEVEFA